LEGLEKSSSAVDEFDSGIDYGGLAVRADIYDIKSIAEH